MCEEEEPEAWIERFIQIGKSQDAKVLHLRWHKKGKLGWRQRDTIFIDYVDLDAIDLADDVQVEELVEQNRDQICLP